MTGQPRGYLVQGEARIASFAFRLPATAGAEIDRCVPPAIQEYQHLAVGAQVLFDAPGERSVRPSRMGVPANVEYRIAGAGAPVARSVSRWCR